MQVNCSQSAEYADRAGTRPCLVLLFDIPPERKALSCCPFRRNPAMQTLVRWYAGSWYTDTGTQVLRYKARKNSWLPDFEHVSHDAVAQQFRQFVSFGIVCDGFNRDRTELRGENFKAHWLSAFGQ